MNTYTLLFASLMLLSGGYTLIAGVHEEKTEKVSPGEADTTGIQSLINGKQGLFKTYEDFAKAKPTKMSFEKWSYVYAGKDKLKYVEAVFEKPDGSDQKYSCEEFWGFRSCDGLYRSFPFENGSVKSVSYRLKMVSDDYYFWETSRMSIYFNPRQAMDQRHKRPHSSS